MKNLSKISLKNQNLGYLKVAIRSFSLKFSNTHEWAYKVKSNTFRIGVSKWAINELGEIKNIDLTKFKIGKQLKGGDGIMIMEAEKAKVNIFSPLTGKVTDRNTSNELFKLIKESPEDQGWLWEMEVEDDSEYFKLMTQDEYRSILSTV